MWAQGPRPRMLGACLSLLTWLSPVVVGPGPSSDLGRRPPDPSSWTLRTQASSVRTPSLAWCTAMSCPWTRPNWTCWWPWPRATSGARSATRSWWTCFKRAIANGQRALPQDGLLDEPGLGVYKRFVRYVAYEILPREVDRHWYFYRHRSCPPPVFMASVTLAQIIVFLCYGARLNKWVLQTYHPEYMKSPLVYHPGHRARAWRFLTYMFMHVGLEQLGFNALLQLMIGVPLEMVHGLLRISLLYLAGVLAGEAELGWDEMSLQAAEDGAGPGVHELRGGPGRVAALLPATACLGPTAQLHGTPGGRSGWCQHGPDHPAQL
ncbi:rhomboid-related protein 1 isoform X4 [Balaenoptera acutorostrata]|uniref:rhomboid protease n=1 Tax=Balaenoptera acutorostrata TaxID=9767 RepID=A0ABM3S453_BALAC|nr:rhomboid-related protein 1 isoform X4 [Balaenoptera acutorostrata]